MIKWFVLKVVFGFKFKVLIVVFCKIFEKFINLLVLIVFKKVKLFVFIFSVLLVGVVVFEEWVFFLFM